MIRMLIVVLRFCASFKNISFKVFCTELDLFISSGLTTGVFMIICPIFLFQGTLLRQGERGEKGNCVLGPLSRDAEPLHFEQFVVS